MREIDAIELERGVVNAKAWVGDHRVIKPLAEDRFDIVVNDAQDNRICIKRLSDPEAPRELFG